MCSEVLFTKLAQMIAERSTKEMRARSIHAEHKCHLCGKILGKHATVAMMAKPRRARQMPMEELMG